MTCKAPASSSVETGMNFFRSTESFCSRGSSLGQVAAIELAVPDRGETKCQLHPSKVLWGLSKEAKKELIEGTLHALTDAYQMPDDRVYIDEVPSENVGYRPLLAVTHGKDWAV